MVIVYFRCVKIMSKYGWHCLYNHVWKSIVIYLYLISPFYITCALDVQPIKLNLIDAFHRHHGKFGGTLLSSFLLALPDCSLPGQLAYSSVGHCCAPFAFAKLAWKFNALPLKRDHPKWKVLFQPLFFRGDVLIFKGGMCSLSSCVCDDVCIFHLRLLVAVTSHFGFLLTSWGHKNHMHTAYTDQ